MANLIIQENGVARTASALHGEEITIKTPCDCSDVTGVQIAGVVYPFYDATGHSLENIEGLFAENSLIRVMIDTDNTRAYILNADTNAYLEGQLANKAPKNHTHTADDVGARPNTWTPSKSDVGLGNVPNVATNNQTPTYSDTTTLATLASGEKLSVAFPKIKLAITNLINHLANKSNPHNVTASQVGAAASSHTHTKSQITDFPTSMTPTAHNQAASTITAGTFSATGIIAKTGTDYTTYRIRNIAYNTGAMTASSTALTNGNMYFQYEN